MSIQYRIKVLSFHLQELQAALRRVQELHRLVDTQLHLLHLQEQEEMDSLASEITYPECRVSSR